jgi:hypothetical protein
MDIKPKEKFIIKQELRNYNINYDADNSLLKPLFNSKEKNKIELNNEINPSNFNLQYNSIKSNLEDKTQFYYMNQSIGAGRGFGDLEVSNEIHFGNSSRDDKQEWKQYKEGTIIDRFDFIDKNIQNPKHLVMDDIPRGGVSTRKQFNLENDNKTKIIFNY